MLEVVHVVEVLRATKEALLLNNSLKLKELSNQTIHSASFFQFSSSVTIAVITYSLGKLIEREYESRVKDWKGFVKRFNLILDNAIKSLEEGNIDRHTEYLQEAMNSLYSISANLKPFIEEVIRKASINKAFKMYEHGISMEQTTKLLGITQWELAEYTGHTNTLDIMYGTTVSIKKRIKLAMDFFS